MEESLKSHHNPSTIQEQKPPSLSNMLDAMDSSVFGHLFSDIQYSDSTTAFGPSPTVNYGSFCQSNDILPNLTPWNSEAQNMANQLKRQRSNIDGDVPCPSKKLTMSSAFTTNPNQSDLPQSYFNPSLFNQALLLNPNYHHFQGWNFGFRQEKPEKNKVTKKKKKNRRKNKLWIQSPTAIDKDVHRKRDMYVLDFSVWMEKFVKMLDRIGYSEV